MNVWKGVWNISQSCTKHEQLSPYPDSAIFTLTIQQPCAVAEVLNRSIYGAEPTPLACAVQVARSSVVVSAADRQVWFPGNDPAPHLDGSMPGDYGFDPLSLGSDPKILKWCDIASCRIMITGL